MRLKDFVRQRRESLGIGGADLSRLCRVTYFCLWSWESGRTLPSRKNLRLLAKALEVDEKVLADVVKKERTAA